MDYVLSFDVGTSALKGILVNKRGEIRNSAIATYQVSFPKDGYAEEDPADWWNGVVKTTKEIMKGCDVNPSDVKGIVFSTQALNVIPIGKDGTILQNAISWMDSRADEEAKEIVEMIGGAEVDVYKRQGMYNVHTVNEYLNIDELFAASKIVYNMMAL